MQNERKMCLCTGLVYDKLGEKKPSTLMDLDEGKNQR